MDRIPRIPAALVVLLLVASAGAWALAHAKPAAVPYPEGYREWTHLKSMAIVAPEHPLYEAFGGIHHVYVNRVGLAAAKRGGPYPDGSVLVFDLLTAESSGGAHTEGARKFIGVMRKDAKAFAATGGWGFEAFAGDSRDRRVVEDAASQCFGCHQPQQASDFTFSRWRP
jgi:hypothetical protein